MSQVSMQQSMPQKSCVENIFSSNSNSENEAIESVITEYEKILWRKERQNKRAFLPTKN